MTNLELALMVGNVMVAERREGAVADVGVLVTVVWKTLAPSAHTEMSQLAPRRTHSSLQLCHQLIVIGPLNVVGLESNQIQFGSTWLRSKAFWLTAALGTQWAAGPADKVGVCTKFEQVSKTTSAEPLPVQPVSSGGLPLK